MLNGIHIQNDIHFHINCDMTFMHGHSHCHSRGIKCSYFAIFAIQHIQIEHWHANEKVIYVPFELNQIGKNGKHEEKTENECSELKLKMKLQSFHQAILGVIDYYRWELLVSCFMYEKKSEMIFSFWIFFSFLLCSETFFELIMTLNDKHQTRAWKFVFFSLFHLISASFFFVPQEMKWLGTLIIFIHEMYREIDLFFSFFFWIREFWLKTQSVYSSIERNIEYVIAADNVNANRECQCLWHAYSMLDVLSKNF